MYCYKLIYDWSRGDILQRFDLVVYLDVKKVGLSLEETVYNQLSVYQSESYTASMVLLFCSHGGVI